jgi:hypothetical protein
MTYLPYIISAYSLSAVVLLGLAFVSWRGWRGANRSVHANDDV